MTFNRSFGLSLVAAALVTVYGCGKEEPAKQQAATPAAAPPAPEVTVKIGHVAPTTGPQAHLGKDNENGARLAVEDANAKGVTIDGKKIKFELDAQDDQADPKQGTIVAQKLVDDKVAGVVGHLNSGTSIPASKIYNDAGIPMISPSATNPKLTLQGFKNVFRVMANDVQQGSVIGKAAVETLGGKKIAIIDDKTAYGAGLADETEKAAKAAGATIVAREHTNDKATDFKAILTKIRAKNPDVIMYGGTPGNSFGSTSGGADPSSEGAQPAQYYLCVTPYDRCSVSAFSPALVHSGSSCTCSTGHRGKIK